MHVRCTPGIMRTMHDRCLVNLQLAKVCKDSQVNILYGVNCRSLGVTSVVDETMVLDQSVSQSSDNSYSRTQTVEGGRCVYEQRHGGMGQSWILRSTSQPAALPPKHKIMTIYNAT